MVPVCKKHRTSLTSQGTESGTNQERCFPSPLSDTRRWKWEMRFFIIQGNADLLLPPSAAALHVSLTTFIRLRLSLSKRPEGKQLSPNHAEYQRQSQK